MKKRHNAGIQAKVLSTLIPSVVLIVGLIVFLFYRSTSKLVIQKSERILSVSAQSVVNQVSSWMNKTITALDTERDTIEFFSLPLAAELDYIKHTADKYESFPAGIYLATTEGKLIHASFVPGPEYNVFEKPWYKEGIESEKFIFGSVYFDENSRSYVVGASGVLKNSEGVVRGVAAADIYLDAISEIVKPITLEQSGAVFLVDGKTNTIIGSKDTSLVGTLADENENAMYRYIAGQITSGVTGLNTYVGADGEEVYISLEKIPDSEWIAAAYVPRTEVMRDLNALVRNLLMIAAVFLAILAAVIFALIRVSVVRPVRKIDHVAKKIAEGELNQEIAYHSGDEFGALADNFNRTVSRLRDYVNYINEISKVLNELAEGELDFKLVYDYVGEFAKVRAALEHISASLNDTLSQIDQAADQVSSGSDQVAAGAQALSQGATQQASSIEELAATINEISGQVGHNAGEAREASGRAAEVQREVMESNQRMQEMLGAMSDISDTSGEIEKIIKTIEDIAFQTNILALNAAVEAARAGAAGKGFAVVADEVRNLANQSSEASKNTAALIETSLKAVENGKQIANRTAESLEAVVEGVKSVGVTMDRISSASEDQAVSIQQVTQGVDQISSVVQTNSATSEESAAASEELSGQASVLKELVGRFHLKEEE